MKKILEKVDKILKKVRQEGKVEVQTRVDLLNELIERTKEKQITLTAKGPQGRKEKLMVSQRGVYLWNEDTYRYDKTHLTEKKLAKNANEYNMQGLIWNGTPYIDPTTGQVIKYCVPGDPESGTGWYEGNGWPGGPYPTDRKYALSFGPLTMAPGDTQEVVIALFIAIGTDHLNSVTELKSKAVEIHHFYGNDYITKTKNGDSEILSQFKLEQNYPNPFNPITKIEYSIAKTAKVELIVFDILGREVTKLVNETKKAGKHEVSFDGSKYASGLYFYRMAIHSDKLKSSDFIQTHKMLLMK